MFYQIFEPFHHGFAIATYAVLFTHINLSRCDLYCLCSFSHSICYPTLLCSQDKVFEISVG